MTPFRHTALVAAAALPLLVFGVAVSGDQGASGVWIAVAWAAAVAILAVVTWRALARPLATVLDEMGASRPDDAVWAAQELKERAALCRQERDRTAELVEDLSSSLGEGIMVVTSELDLRMINPVALRFCGAERVDEGTHLLEILRNPEAVGAVEAAAAGSRPRPLLVENRRGLWELRAFPVRQGGAVVLVSDVGQVRRAAEFRRRFVQDLSHELRSPLAVLRTTVEAAEEEIDTRLGAILVRQVERLDRLTNELYELASLESGQVELRLEQVELASVVREVVRDFGPEMERIGVEAQVEVEPGLAVRSDRRGVYRVLSNLVDNAVKYNRAGGWVRVTASAANGDVALVVADSGEGIPSAELGAVLQRFYRVDRARTPGRGGLGLGLAIVKHMVQHLGGRIELDSREGVGTTVTITLPGVTVADPDR